jgi:hypothetical protein
MKFAQITNLEDDRSNPPPDLEIDKQGAIDRVWTFKILRDAEDFCAIREVRANSASGATFWP